MTMARWADEIGITVYALSARLAGGKRSVEEAIDYRPPLIEHAGLSLTATEWAAVVGMKRNTISKRIAAGWPPEKALTHPATRGRVVAS